MYSCYFLQGSQYIFLDRELSYPRILKLDQLKTIVFSYINM